MSDRRVKFFVTLFLRSYSLVPERIHPASIFVDTICQGMSAFGEVARSRPSSTPDAIDAIKLGKSGVCPLRCMLP